MADVKNRLASLSPEKRALLAHRLSQRKRSTAADDVALPAVEARPAERFEPFPLTGLQQAYWMGRTDAFALGNLASRAYLELDAGALDRSRLAAAWQGLIERHEMLRVIVHDDGTQQILEKTPPYEIAHLELSGRSQAETRTALEQVRDEMLQAQPPSDEWPLFEVRTTQLPDAQTRLHFTFDLLNVDAASISLLFRELRELYERPDQPLPPLALSFRDYHLHEQTLQELPGFQRARDYWLRRVEELPPAPALPTAVAPTAIRSPRFVRCSQQIDGPVTETLKARAREMGVTHTALLLAAYAEILARWSAVPRFTINIPLLNRQPVHPQVDAIVGPFSTVSLLAVDDSAPESFDRRARRIQEQLLDDLDHRQFDGVGVQRELARLRGAGEAAMPVVFTGLLDHDFADSVSGFGEVVSAVNQTAQVWMDLHVDERAGSFVFKWDAVEGLFPSGMVEDMLDAYCRLLQAVADDVPLASLLPAPQLERRAAINATEVAVLDQLAHGPFQEQAARRPDHPAVVSSDRRLSYGELQGLARRIGRRLRSGSAQPDGLVAIAMERGWEQVAAVLGVLESGAAYLPVDAELPKERLHYLLDHARVETVLTQTRVAGRIDWPEGVEVLCVDDDDTWQGLDDAPREPAQTPGQLAYVLYTSGSTGLPKGVMIEHRSVVNRMTDVIERFGIGPDDRVIAVTALHHDLSVFDIFAGLGAGATLVIPDAATRRDPAHWAELVAREGVTLWNSVPAFMEMFVEYLEHSNTAPAPDSLRRVMLSGDWIPVSLPDRIRAASPGTEVTGLGGPTETTVWDICNPIGAVDPGWKSIPYGKPLSNARYHVLNGQLEPCPDWVTGELYIGGAGLARGYWRDAEKTSEKFFVHPQTGERLYRSGDLGRYLPDGSLEFMGRADFQVKIQGQRIELGEIEAALLEHPALQAVVAAAVSDGSGRTTLAAYVVATDEAPSAGELRDFLAEKIAGHMIPTAFVALERLPLTANGKVDRKNLPDPFEATAEARPVAEGRVSDGLESQIAGLVREVLQVSEVDPETSLLSYGANSIDLVRLGNQLESSFGERPRIDELFRLDTVRALAGYYDARRKQPAGSSASGDGLMTSDVAALVASYRVLIDPDEREAVKDSQPGIRRFDEEQPVVKLAQPLHDAAFEQPFRERGSTRVFSLKPIPFETFSGWLCCLSQITLDGKPKYRYASGGTLYPNQVYLHVQPGRIEGVDAGTYYYHPVDHTLVLLEPNAELDRDIHIPFINTPVFDEAAFSVFIVAEVAAIAPSYGDRSIHFVTIEAGLITQLLETAATGTGIGMTNVGTIDFDRVRHLFHLERSHVLIHSLLGGRLRDGAAPGDEAGPADANARVGNLAERIQDLSPEEVRSLLAATDAAREDDGDS